MAYLVVIPVLSALIGYLTNVIAIRMLFRPRKPHYILGFNLQGVLPKRQSEIAASLGKLVEEQLLSSEDIFQAMNSPRVKEQIISSMVVLLQDRLHTALPKVLSGSISKLLGDNLEKIIRQEAETLLEKAFIQGKVYIENEKPVSKMVERKILAFQLDELEELVRKVSSQELRFIELIGGVLGLAIGLAQVIFLLLWPH